MFQRLIQPFVDRFEPDGPDYLYRSNPSEAAVRVTAAERDAFIMQFRATISQTLWLVIIGAIIVAPIVTTTMMPASVGRFVTVLSPAFFGMIYLAIYRWAARAPSRKLRSRATVGVGKSREEARAIMLSKLTWRNLVLLALANTLVLYSKATQTDLTAGVNRLWLFGAAVLYAILAYRVYQKLRYGSVRSPAAE
jgi:hypothetical protein